MDPTLMLGLGLIFGLGIGGTVAGLAFKQIFAERIKARDDRLTEFEVYTEQVQSDHSREIENMQQAAQKQLAQWLQEKATLQKAKEESVALKEAQLASERAAAAEILATAKRGAVETQHNLKLQLQQLREDEGRLQNAFAKLAQDSLSRNKDEFLTLAGLKVQPLVDLQKRLEEEIHALELKRESAYTALNQSAAHLSEEARQLNRMLTTSNLRGGWGELQLKRVVELAGLTEGIDFERQVAGDGIQPDLVVGLPGRREIVVDSKAPLDAYRQSMEVESEEERTLLLEKHAKVVREHLDKLSRKEYQTQFDSLEFVVVFIPVEAAYYAALKQDPDLIDFQAKKKVLVAGPVTLLAILKAVAYSWREVRMVTNASKIGELAEEFQRRLRTFAEHLDNVGKQLNDAVKAHSKAVGSFQRNLIPQARTLEKYLATDAEKLIPEPREVEEEIRLLGVPNERIELDERIRAADPGSDATG